MEVRDYFIIALTLFFVAGSQIASCSAYSALRLLHNTVKSYTAPSTRSEQEDVWYSDES